MEKAELLVDHNPVVHKTEGKVSSIIFLVEPDLASIPVLKFMM